MSLTGGSATFDSKNVGQAKTVTLTGAELTGTDKGNYTLSSVETEKADITALSITGSFTAADKPYDGNATAQILTRSLAGVLGADEVRLFGDSASFSNRSVGTDKTVTGTGFALVGDGASNYALSSSTLTTTASITRLAVVGHFSAGDKIYDGTTDATVTGRSLSGVVGNDDVRLVGGTATFDSKNAGADKTVTLKGAELEGDDAANYALTEPTLTATATVKKAAPRDRGRRTS